MSICPTSRQYSDSCTKRTQSESTELSSDCSSSLNCFGLSQLESNRRTRREIANSNERKRMQTINAGFQALKMLIPHKEGDKLSKATLLHQTAEYIFSLEQDKTRLLQQNTSLKRLIANCGCQQLLDKRSLAKRQKFELSTYANSKEEGKRSTVLAEKEERNLDENSHGIEEERLQNILKVIEPTSRQNLDSIVLAIKHLDENKNDTKEAQPT